MSRASAIPDSMKMPVLDSLLSRFPSWSADDLNLGDHTLGLFELASVFVVENAKSNPPKHSFVLVVPVVVSNCFLEGSLFHDLLVWLKDTDRD